MMPPAASRWCSTRIAELTSCTDAPKASAWCAPCWPNALIWTLASASAAFRSPVLMPSLIAISSPAAMAMVMFQVDPAGPHAPFERHPAAPERDEWEGEDDQGIGDGE